MLSEEYILDLWSPGRPTLGKNKVIAFARAIEREVLKEVKVQIPTATMEQEFAWHQRQGFIRGHRQGQERMRERAAVASWMHYAEICKKLNINPHDTHYGKFIAADAIRNLEIEEPTK